MTSILDTFLAEPVVSTATKVLKDSYSKLVAHGNLTSYSMQGTFHACPRKFQFAKLQAAAGLSERQTNVTFAFGHSVGAGVAEFDSTCSIDQAIWAAFLAWDMDLLEIETKGTYADGTGKPTGKSFAMAVWALEKYESFLQETNLLDDYIVDKIEATVAIDFEDGHFYTGHIDELLVNQHTNQLLVKENKTTGLTTVDPVLYANSDQALSYAVVVDMCGGTDYSVLYTVYSSKTQEWQYFLFPKSGLKKAEWLQDQLLIHQTIDSYAELDFFPKRGASCFEFMRRCALYERCDLNPSTAYGQKFSDLPKITGKADLDAIEPIDFYTTLTEITNRQKERL